MNLYDTSREGRIREKYGLNPELFYQEIKYWPPGHRGVYKDKIDYAGVYITKIKKMYAEETYPEFEHMFVPELIEKLTIMDKNDSLGILNDKDKDLKEHMYNTLIAKRLLFEAVCFVGERPFDQIIRRPVSKRHKEESKHIEEIRPENTEGSGRTADTIPSKCEEPKPDIIENKESGREGDDGKGGYVLAC